MMGRASQYIAGTVAIPNSAAGSRTVQSCSPSAATLRRSSSEFMRCWLGLENVRNSSPTVTDVAYWNDPISSIQRSLSSR
jgi:hypothetical protein